MSSHRKNKIIAGVMLALCALESVAFAGNPCDEYAALRAVLQTKREGARKAYKQLVKLDNAPLDKLLEPEENLEKLELISAFSWFSFVFEGGAYLVAKPDDLPVLFKGRVRGVAFVVSGLSLIATRVAYHIGRKYQDNRYKLMSATIAYDQEIKIAYEKVVELEIKHGCY